MYLRTPTFSRPPAAVGVSASMPQHKSRSPPYRPGMDRKSDYKSVWQKYWHGFRVLYSEQFEPVYGGLPGEKALEVSKLLSCSDYRNGFRKHVCPDCGTVLMVPFTCKSRLCLSCYRKKLYGWSMNLSHIMNTGLSHFHVTFTLPGLVTRILFDKRFFCEDLIAAAAGVYWKELLKSAGNPGKKWQSGISDGFKPVANPTNATMH